MKATVEVTQWIEVEIDESKLTPDWLAEFRKSFYPFETINDHLEHLAQLNARGLADDDHFIEGYGPAAEMGIRFKEQDIQTRIEEA